MIRGLFDRTIGLLERTLNLRLQNQQAISANIANADTPGYTPARLDFEAGLQQALGPGNSVLTRTDPAHLGPAPGEARLQRDPPRPVGDGNGVDLDQEMLALAENQIFYEAASQMISKKLGLLKYVAQEGR